MWHQGHENKKLRRECGYPQLPQPPNSLGFNPNEIHFGAFEMRAQKHFLEKEHCLHIIFELFAIKWEQIDQGTIANFINSTPQEIKAMIEASGGHMMQQ